METHARYTLIGLYALAVLAAGFAFVYWLNTSGGLGQRAAYQVRFDAPVSGLLKGSAVLFNGIRVGEVTGLRLDARTPSDVLVDISVVRDAPVRADSRIGIEFQGLTGSPVVSLAGGSPSLPLLAQAKEKPPVLIAEKNAGLGMTQAARDVLQQINGVVKDNAEPLKNTIASLDKFSAVLARNSDRVDGIMAGIERLTGGGQKSPSQAYDLAAATTFPAIAKLPDVQLAVVEPTALSLYDNDKIQLRSPGGGKPALDNAQWPDLLPKVIQARLVQSFENARYLKALGKSPDVAKADFQLLTDIRGFHLSAGTETAAEIEISARLMTTEGRVADARIFKARVPVATPDTPSAAKALSAAFEKVAGDIVVWTLAAL